LRFFEKIAKKMFNTRQAQRNTCKIPRRRKMSKMPQCSASAGISVRNFIQKSGKGETLMQVDWNISADQPKSYSYIIT
jgi:hypothetical protein